MYKNYRAGFWKNLPAPTTPEQHRAAASVEFRKSQLAT